MDTGPVDVLWWFYTILLSTAFAQLAVALAVLWKVRAGAGTPLNPPTMLWLVFLIILTIEVWIAVSYYVKTVSSMSIISLLAFLWVPMGILFLGVFLADTTWIGSAPQSDEERFNRLRKSFFTVLLLIPVVNFAHELYLGTFSVDADLIFPALIAVGAVIGYFIRTVRADTVLAAAMLVVITVYLVTSYGTISAL